MTNIPYETKQNGSAHEKRFIAILKHLKYIKISKSYIFQVYSLRKTIVGSNFFLLIMVKYIQNQYLCLVT